MTYDENEKIKELAGLSLKEKWGLIDDVDDAEQLAGECAFCKFAREDWKNKHGKIADWEERCSICLLDPIMCKDPTSVFNVYDDSYRVCENGSIDWDLFEDTLAIMVDGMKQLAEDGELSEQFKSTWEELYNYREDYD